MARDTWQTVELPILDAITELTSDRSSVHNMGQIVDATRLDEADVALAIGRLYEAGYVPARHLNAPGGWPCPALTDT